MNKIETQYNINLGLTDSDFLEIKEGGIKFHFTPTEDSDYDKRITISIKSVEEDSTLEECMNLSVDKAEVIL